MHHENKRNSFYHNARLAERTKLQQRCYDAMMFCLTNTVHLMLVNSICSQKKKSQQKIYLKNSYHTGSHRYTYTHTHTLTRHMSYWVTVDINTPAYIIWVVHKIKRLWLQGLGGGFSSLLFFLWLRPELWIFATTLENEWITVGGGGEGLVLHQ